MKEIDEAFFDLPSNRTAKSKITLSNDLEPKPNLTSQTSTQKKMIEDYIIKETIGKGTFSVVKLGENINTKQKVAIKILDKEKIKTKEDLNRIQREIKILSILDHPYIIKTYKISETPKKYYIIMEYCEGGELFDYIVEKERLDESEASIFFYQLINALEYIHSKGVAHRDLKPENLLLTTKKSIKIIDFGLSNFFEGNIASLETPCGSPSYASPEIIKGEIYNGFKIDVWASGIILFAMLCGYLPFDDDEEEEKEDDSKNKKYFSQSNTNSKEEKSEDNEILFQKILEGKIEFPEYLSENAVDLIKKMLVVDPEDRIEIKDIIKHKFYLLGKKNYLLYQKNLAEHEIYDNLNSYFYGINNKNNNNNNISDNSNLIDKDKNIINSENYSFDISIINKPQKENINKNNNSNDISDNNNKNIIKNEEIKNVMEEYEKKLFDNYLKKVAEIKKKNTKNKNLKNNNNNKENKIKDKKNIYINLNKDNNLKKFYSKKRNNYTLNEIVLNFNPIKDPIESYKQILTTPTIQKYNYNNNFNFSNNSYDNKINNNVPTIKLNAVKLKKLEKNNYNILYQNLNTINAMPYIAEKTSKIKNKFLKDINYHLENNYKEEKKENKNNNIKYPRISLSQRYPKNKPILPVIKTNIIGIGNLGDMFLSNKLNRYVLTEANNKNIKKKIIFKWDNILKKNGLVDLRNKIKSNIGSNHFSNDKYKLSLPSSFKKYNIPIFKGPY